MQRDQLQRSRCSLQHQQGLCHHISRAPRALLLPLLLLLLMALVGKPRAGQMGLPH
jgi:hypothetical protein